MGVTAVAVAQVVGAGAAVGTGPATADTAAAAEPAGSFCAKPVFFATSSVHFLILSALGPWELISAGVLAAKEPAPDGTGAVAPVGPWMIPALVFCLISSLMSNTSCSPVLQMLNRWKGGLYGIKTSQRAIESTADSFPAVSSASVSSVTAKPSLAPMRGYGTDLKKV